MQTQLSVSRLWLQHDAERVWKEGSQSRPFHPVWKDNMASVMKVGCGTFQAESQKYKAAWEPPAAGKGMGWLEGNLVLEGRCMGLNV